MRCAAASRDALSIKGFELEAERMARLMRDNYRIGFVDIGGWDTHVNEGAAQGALASNLTGLGRGLAVFAQALGAEWKNTVVVVLSEFGRTFRENGNRGTDHGHGRSIGCWEAPSTAAGSPASNSALERAEPVPGPRLSGTE